MELPSRAARLQRLHSLGGTCRGLTRPHTASHGTVTRCNTMLGAGDAEQERSGWRPVGPGSWPGGFTGEGQLPPEVLEAEEEPVQGWAVYGKAGAPWGTESCGVAGADKGRSQMTAWPRLGWPWKVRLAAEQQRAQGRNLARGTHVTETIQAGKACGGCGGQPGLAGGPAGGPAGGADERRVSG